MKCGWGCGAQLTGRKMRAHFTICPNQPAVVASITKCQMRAHFTMCPNRPADAHWACECGSNAVARDSRRSGEGAFR